MITLREHDYIFTGIVANFESFFSNMHAQICWFIDCAMLRLIFSDEAGNEGISQLYCHVRIVQEQPYYWARAKEVPRKHAILKYGMEHSH